MPASSAARDIYRNNRTSSAQRRYNPSTEYDLSRFETPDHAEALKRRERLRVVTTPMLQRMFGTRAAIAKFVLCVGMLVALFSVSLYSRAVLATINEDINAKTAELSTLTGEYTRLQTELESKISLKNIEEYATANLGMMKIDSTQVQYLNAEETESVTLYSTAGENTLPAKIGRFLSELAGIFGLNIK